MNPGYALAFVSSVLFGAGDFLGGHAARRASTLTVTFVSMAAGLLGLCLAALVVHGRAVPTDFAWAATAGLLGGLGVAFLYRAFALGPISVAAPLVSLTLLAVPVVVGLAGGERPSSLALAGIGLAALSFPLLSDTGAAAEGAARRALHRTITLAIIAGLLCGLFLTVIRRVGPDAGVGPLFVARLVSVFVFGAIVLARREPKWPPAGARLATIGAGIFDTLANVAFYVAVHRGPLAIIGTIVALSPATTVTLARLLHAERWSGPQRIGLALAAAAIVCVSLG